MKTTKILISSALLALATTTFGQLGAIKERLRAEKAEPVQYHQVGFTIHSNHGQKFTGLESWMAVPFEIEVDEEELYVESWMTEPFETEVAEEELSLESWMFTPFYYDMADDELQQKDWITAANWK